MVVICIEGGVMVGYCVMGRFVIVVVFISMMMMVMIYVRMGCLMKNFVMLFFV